MKKVYAILAGAMFFNMQASAQGIDLEGTQPLFDINFVDAYGIESISGVHPTLARCGAYIVVNPGNGATPVYVDAATGAKKGEIVLGDAVPTGTVASDNVGNMLIGNYCEARADIKLYKTSSVTATPELFIDWNNDNSLPLGNRIHVQGDLNGDAVIVAACEGVSGVTGTKNFFRWEVKNGVAGQPVKYEFTDASMEYWVNGANNAKIASKSVDIADGYFVGYYKADKFFHVNGDATAVEEFLVGPGGNYDANSCDSRPFNGADYTVLMDQSHFPQWGLTGSVYVYDTTDINTTNFSGTVSSAQCLLTTIPMADFSADGTKSGICTGDVLLANTDDMMGVYFITSTYLNFGGVAFPALKSAISEINTDCQAPVEYYNLQGVRIASPQSGLYIRRQGDKAEKVFVK